MSCFISELLVPEDVDSLLGLYCQHCRSRKECPYVWDQALRRAACQGRAAARSLAAEADRLLEAVSGASDVRCLLNADEALERGLSHALCSEMALIDDLRAHAISRGP